MEFHTSLDPLPSFDWDLPAFGVCNTEMSSYSSTGYLQDAIFQWSDPCKRRKLLLFNHERSSQTSDNMLQECLAMDFEEDPHLNFISPSQEPDIDMVSETHLSSSINSMSSGGVASPDTETKTEEHISSSSSSDHKEAVTENADGKSCSVPGNLVYSSANHQLEGRQSRCKKKSGARIAYPFALVKPGGMEGDVTLNDINKRILMRPTRPVRHPVGEFACVPCISAGGPGPSGKAVVAFTRIQTQGKGTITIIRTRG